MNEWYDQSPRTTPPAPETPPAEPVPEEAGTSSYYKPAADGSYRYVPPRDPSPAPETPKKKPAKKGLKPALLALAAAVLGGAVGAGAVFGGLRLLGGGNAEAGANILLYESPRGVSVETVTVEPGELMSAAEVYARNVNSTVGITTSVTTNFFGYQTTSAAAGSGFILSADGYILTNYHVVEGSDSIQVSLNDGSEYDAELIGYDAASDIAVLKVQAEDLVPVVLGSSDDLLVGQEVVAIGNPLGELTFSLTQGIVSALDRDITLSSGVQRSLIQTDCAINSGNSGGALFNLRGEVIGITNAKYSSNSMGSASIDNIGFAIPIDLVRPMVESIIETGYVVKPWIGITVTAVSADSQALGLPQGAAINSVTAGGPAEKAGLLKNDIITRAGDRPITSSGELVEIIGEAAPGDKIPLTVYRQGETLEITVTVDENRQEALPQTQPAAPSQPESVPQMPQGQSPEDLLPYLFGEFFNFF